MKNLPLFLGALLASFMFSCTNQDEQPEVGPELETVDLAVKVGAPTLSNARTAAVDWINQSEIMFTIDGKTQDGEPWAFVPPTDTEGGKLIDVPFGNAREFSASYSYDCGSADIMIMNRINELDPNITISEVLNVARSSRNPIVAYEATPQVKDVNTTTTLETFEMNPQNGRMTVAAMFEDQEMPRFYQAILNVHAYDADGNVTDKTAPMFFSGSAGWIDVSSCVLTTGAKIKIALTIREIDEEGELVEGGVNKRWDFKAEDYPNQMVTPGKAKGFGLIIDKSLTPRVKTFEGLNFAFEDLEEVDDTIVIE
ncbi:hypothetical protein KMW28_01420 [Flammeovirga yaeyamensis]|uniref:Lipoprotein n=1 Tax=Flammeovirga yaeyamensis TaxID=367791 RepID=A0AAX1N7Q7_9BACT|nr:MULTISPECIES: hypothetical protein [Flammeovirga]ANQ50304.1 hypothetical protein MY04_2936 [Flammeovirga sp. MY04]MBB3699744.1 hypothetical protein [Flammeovirga yaeyamensis]NMF36686.1 hypothetical protein [Flammeovirga yaeyamensis]QWG02270.1 hypothetical protein KMW28_01420 [Flammeovirga yaeyamensis]